MDDISKINFDNEIIIRKEPSTIYSYNIILGLFIIIVLIIGNIIKYCKCENLVANIIKTNENNYIEMNLKQAVLKNLKDYELYIDNKKYYFEIIELNQNISDNNYNVLISINDEKNELENLKYIVISLKSKRTTLFKEIFKRIKEEMKI